MIYYPVSLIYFWKDSLTKLLPDFILNVYEFSPSLIIKELSIKFQGILTIPVSGIGAALTRKPRHQPTLDQNWWECLSMFKESGSIFAQELTTAALNKSLR